MKASRGITITEAAIVAFIVGLLAAVCPAFDGGVGKGLAAIGCSPLVAVLARKLGAPKWAAFVISLAVAWFGLGVAARGLPRSSYANIIRKSKENAARDQLSALRSRLAHEPKNDPFQDGKRTADLWPFHPSRSAVRRDRTPDDAGGWLFDRGLVWVNCTHTDTRGTTWTAY